MTQEASTSEVDVVLVSNGFQTEYEVGFVNGLAANGISALLVASSNTAFDRLHSGVRTINLRGSQDPGRSMFQKVSNLLRYWLMLWRLLRQHGKPVHLIGLFTLRSNLAAMAEALALRLASPRFVMTVHNLLPHDRHSTWDRWAYRFIYRMPHSLVVHTQRMKEELALHFGVLPGRVWVMEHGIDRLLPLDEARRAAARDTYGVSPSECLVLFFGNLARYKGLDLLLEAWGQLPAGTPARLLIAGRCRDAALRDKIRLTMGKLPDPASVEWHDGFVPEDDVASYFFAADLLVLPYRRIDQSGVVFMAMSCGLPVLATDVGSLRDYVAHTGGEVVAPGDVQALMRATNRRILSYCSGDALARRSERLQQMHGFLWANTVTPIMKLFG